MYWRGYDYWIEDDRIRTPDDLLDWIHQFGENTWEGMTPYKIRKLIEAVRTHWGVPVR